MELGDQVLYFALRPPPDAAAEAAARLAPFVRSLGLTGRPTPADRLHVSLNGLGRFARTPPQVVEMACRAAATVRRGPFRVAFSRLGAWGRGEGPRPVVLAGDEGVVGVERLHEALHAALARPGMVRGRPRPYRPHMTLLRDRRAFPETMVEPVSWTVEAFVLILSFHGQGRQEVLGRWPLVAEPPAVGGLGAQAFTGFSSSRIASPSASSFLATSAWAS